MGYNEKIKIIMGDITQQETDAIVNAANESLLGGGGVDGAIHRAAGPELLEACKKYNGCPTGEARITKGYNLKARFVIHTVGPRWKGGNNGEPGLLSACYNNALKLAIENSVKTISFPSISTGAFGYPIVQASKIALKTIDAFLKKDTTIQTVFIVCFSDEDAKIYRDQSIGPDLGD
ncbi:MAG: O-acetyl-ADP-ribose deacetylase [Chitinophagales bacterium]